MPSDEEAQAFVVASRALVGIAARSVLAAPIEHTVVQQRVLVLLATRGPLSLTQIAEELGIDLSNASRLCDRLQKNFLVERCRQDGDRRVVEVSITKAGMNLLAAVDDFRREEVKKVLSGMSRSEIEAAVEALTVFAARAGEVNKRWG